MAGEERASTLPLLKTTIRHSWHWSSCVCSLLSVLSSTSQAVCHSELCQCCSCSNTALLSTYIKIRLCNHWIYCLCFHPSPGSVPQLVVPVRFKYCRYYTWLWLNWAAPFTHAHTHTHPLRHAHLAQQWRARRADQRGLASCQSSTVIDTVTVSPVAFLLPSLRPSVLAAIESV